MTGWPDAARAVPKAAGVDFVCSGAKFLSASHRNMERMGMRIQFVRAIWTPVRGAATVDRVREA